MTFAEPITGDARAAKAKKRRETATASGLRASTELGRTVTPSSVVQGFSMISPFRKRLGWRLDAAV